MKIIKKCMASPPALALFVSTGLVLFVLFIKPIGMADNGDFYRIINGNGIYKLDRDQKDQYFQYFSKEFGTFEYYNESQNTIISSQTPFIQAALALDRLFTGADNRFDIRFLSGILSLWCLLNIYLLVDYAAFGLQKRYGYGIAALAVYLFADVGYTAYFNSFYAEGLVYVSFLSAMASALLIFQKRHNLYLLLTLYIFSSVVLTTAKQQNAPLGVLLGLLIIPLMLSLPKKQGLRKKKAARRRTVAVAVCSISLCVCGALVYYLIPQEFVDINKYHAMTRGILMTSQNPETALEHFGIDPQYSLLDGSIFFERYPAADVEGEDLKTRFYPNYGFVSVSLYYLEHPSELLQMLDAAAKNAYNIPPEAMGNYERSAGKEPGQKSWFFKLHSYLKARIAPKTVGFMILWIVAILGLGFRNRGRTLVLACAILMGLSQIGVSIIGAGDADLSKHIFLYNVVYDLCNFVMLSTVFFRWRSDKRQAKTTGLPIVQASDAERSANQMEGVVSSEAGAKQ